MGRLADAYLRFYFRFVDPNLTRIQASGGKFGLKEIGNDAWDSFLGLGFERLVSGNLAVVLDRLAATDRLRQSGTYWQARSTRREGVQIDMVRERDDGVTHLVECKWLRKAIGQSVLAELERKCALYPNPHQHTLVPVLVAAAGATPAVLESGTSVITLADLLRR